MGTQPWKAYLNLLCIQIRGSADHSEGKSDSLDDELSNLVSQVYLTSHLVRNRDAFAFAVQLRVSVTRLRFETHKVFFGFKLQRSKT